jgi:hypothetical protein
MDMGAAMMLIRGLVQALYHVMVLQLKRMQGVSLLIVQRNWLLEGAWWGVSDSCVPGTASQGLSVSASWPFSPSTYGIAGH